MSSGNIFLVVVSGLGVAHGLFLALFLWIYPKGHQLSNRLLSLLLVIFAFRIGKSVLLEFANEIAIELIFIGLGSMLAIGPLFYLFVQSSVDKAFVIKQRYLIHFLPAIFGIVFGLWLNKPLFESLPKILFASLFLGYYIQFLAYLIISLRLVRKKKKMGLPFGVGNFLSLLTYALFAIWFVYFLNLIDEIVPYIFGPILYSSIVYMVSFIVIRKGYLQEIHKEKYSTTSIPEEKANQLFNSIIKLMEGKKIFKSVDINLKSLSEHLKVTPQVLSMTINQKTGKNFNTFVNHYRIQEAAQLLRDDNFKSHTISSIAYEVGFNSISSFNTNFKSQIGKTPAVYRKQQ